MWLKSADITHFLMNVSQGTAPNFSKGWCINELIMSFAGEILIVLAAVKHVL